MAEKPHIICHMTSSLDGGPHASRWTDSPTADKKEWSDIYERIHREFDADAWIVGRVTMAEMSKADAHRPREHGAVERPFHFATREGKFGIALDRSGKLHFSDARIMGDRVLVVLGPEVPDAHLAELAADGISYIVAEDDLAAILDVLVRELNIRTLLLEGGATINGSFFAAGLVDELSVLLAPTLDGRAKAQRFIEFGEEGLAGKAQLSLDSVKELDHGLLHLRYRVTPD